ncbi:hypothetical protein ACF1B0_18970 [Streptomyces anandii]|uniref:hypothetical protein n=1 Tax=Streptomyces anandii TaxID=285454 RepID=UPI0036F97203
MLPGRAELGVPVTAPTSKVGTSPQLGLNQTPTIGDNGYRRTYLPMAHCGRLTGVEMIKRAGFYRETGGEATAADDTPSLRGPTPGRRGYGPRPWAHCPVRRNQGSGTHDPLVGGEDVALGAHRGVDLHREEAVAALVRTLDQDAAVCRGFVIDRAGVSASQDWDRILAGDAGRFTVWPDTVGILRDRVGNHPELADSEPTAYGPLDVFHRA